MATTTARVAGGWVRDKLLNRQSHDIDIVLDTHSGVEFLTLFKEKATLLDFSSIGVIKMNPEKSKHLETAAVLIDGVHVDFMQFRSEIYNDTRIPIVKEGTIEQDVLRRDLTVNALYYNINNDTIEDITGQGIEDLNNKVIRTPLDPRITFLDDPLRVLRVVRFMVQLKFTIRDDIMEAIKCEDVRDALRNKLSNERVGIEVLKIIEAENGYEGMLWIIENNLVREVFKPNGYENIETKEFGELSRDMKPGVLHQENKSPEFKPEDSFNQYVKCDVENVRNFVDRFRKCKYTLDRSIFNLYTILHIFMDRRCGNSFVNVEILRVNLKWTRAFANRISRIEENVNILKRKKLRCDDIELIMLIRRMGSDWLNSFYLFYFVYQADSIPDVCDYIFLKGYECADSTKPLLRGDVIWQRLNCGKSEIQKWIEISVGYQISEEFTDSEALIAVLIKLKANEDQNKGK